MKVLTEQVVRFRTGEALAPEEVNRVMLYAQDTVDDVAERRFSLSSVTFPFVLSATVATTNATAARVRTWRFACPVTCVVLRGFLNGNLVAAAEARLDFYLTGTTTNPSGATAPYLTAPIATVAATDVSDVNVDKVMLVAGQVYDLVLSGTSFSAERLDLTLHVAVDRWQAGGVAAPAFSPTLFIDESPDATVVNINTANLATEAAKFSAASGMVPLLFWAQGFATGHSANLLRFALPRWLSSRANARIVRSYLQVAMASTGGGSIDTFVLDQASGIVGSLSSGSLAAVDDKTVASGALNIPLTSAASETPANDYSVTLSNSGAVVCTRASLLLWVQWG